MISVEQVRALEERVEKAIAYIAALKSENADLRRDHENARAELAKAASRIADLEAAAETFRHDQIAIEAGIVHALQKLDAFEDLVLRVEAAPKPVAPAAPVPEARSAPLPASAVAIAAEAQAEAAIEPAAETDAEPASSAGSGIQAVGKTADELSLDELEAATAPSASPEPAMVQTVENELDIF
jgi:FtsZ-binding cell division protein ZapB